MKRIKLNVKTHTKLIGAGAALVLFANPLSLVFLADGADIAMIWLAQLIQLGFKYLVVASPYIMGLAGVLIVLGAGIKIGADSSKKTAKLKKAKGGTNNMAYEV